MRKLEILFLENQGDGGDNRKPSGPQCVERPTIRFGHFDS